MRVYEINTRGLLTRPLTQVAHNYLMRKANREKRYGKPVTYNPPNTKGERWIENIAGGMEGGLRVRNAHEVLPRIRHTGWFVDDWQEEMVCGLVVQLPARKDGTWRGRKLQKKLYHSVSPTEMYYPGVSDAWNDGCGVVDFTQCTADKLECARWADSMAERYAEEEREYRREIQPLLHTEAQQMESERVRREEEEQEQALEDGYAGLGVRA